MHIRTQAHTHTHTRWQPMLSVLRPVPAGELTLTVPCVSQMAAEQNSSEQQRRVNAQLYPLFHPARQWREDEPD